MNIQNRSPYAASVALFALLQTCKTDIGKHPGVTS
jgi:hypothetical protein